MAGKRFWQKIASRLCRYPVGQKFRRNRSSSLRFRDKEVVAFYAEIQDGHQKWRENKFCKTLTVASADTLWVKNFVEISLARSVSVINTLLRFTQRFKMATKSSRKTIFAKKLAIRPCRYPVGQKLRRNHSSSLRFRDKHVFAFYAEIQDSRQKWRENDFGETLPVDSADTLWVENFVEIALARSVSEINASLRFTQKFKMAVKRDRKTIFVKRCQ